MIVDVFGGFIHEKHDEIFCLLFLELQVLEGSSLANRVGSVLSLNSSLGLRVCVIAVYMCWF